MKGFIEWIWCPVFIIRVGEDCDKYGKPFDFAIAVVIPWLSVFKWIIGSPAPVIIKALVVPKFDEESRPLMQRHARVAFRLIKRAGFNPTWERFK